MSSKLILVDFKNKPLGVPWYARIRNGIWVWRYRDRDGKWKDIRRPLLIKQER